MIDITKEKTLKDILKFLDQKEKEGLIYNYKFCELFESVFINEELFYDNYSASISLFNYDIDKVLEEIKEFQVLYYGSIEGKTAGMKEIANSYYKAVAFHSIELLDSINKYWNEYINKDTLKEFKDEIESVLYWL